MFKLQETKSRKKFWLVSQKHVLNFVEQKMAGKVCLITLNTEKVEKNKTRARVTSEIHNTNKWFK